MPTDIKNIDPVQGLIDYVNDIKPYHSKVIEALIEYVGVENIQVSMFEDYHMDIGFVFKINDNLFCLGSGFAANPYGDPEHIYILSPDPSKSVKEYPAFLPGYFIVLGDKTSLFDPLLNLDFNVSTFIEDKLVDVNKSTGSPPTGGYFSVIGNRSAYFSGAGIAFTVNASDGNDGDYVTSSVTVGGFPIRTTLFVEGYVVDDDNVPGFVSIPDIPNTGNFVVLSSNYNAGILIPHTIVFITGITMNTPILLDDNQRIVSRVDVANLAYDMVLSYSNALVSGSPPTGTPTHIPDEGIVILPILGITTAPDGFSVLGDYDRSNIYVGDEITVQSSINNNGPYTITSITTVFDTSGSPPLNDYITTFGVASIPLPVVSGTLKLNIPSNVFVIKNDFTSLLYQGIKLTVAGGTAAGIFTILNSKFYNNSTYIRVKEDILKDGAGRLIVGVSGGLNNIVTVDGDASSIYLANSQFNIIRSINNNGRYTVVNNSVFDISTNTTSIDIVEPINITDNTGEIHEFITGTVHIKETGFAESPEFCDLIPNTLVQLDIKEILEIDTVPINVNNNTIMEGIILPPLGFVATATFREDLNILDGGYTFNILATTTNTIDISDPSGSILTAFTTGMPPVGSPPVSPPPDDLIEIISSTSNNGEHVITGATNTSNITTLTVSVPITAGGQDGNILYQRWFQYMILNTTSNGILVLGDATGDLNNGNTIKITYSSVGSPPLSNNGVYTINTPPIFDGNNTTISTTETLPLLNDSGSWVEST